MHRHVPPRHWDPAIPFPNETRSQTPLAHRFRARVERSHNDDCVKYRVGMRYPAIPTSNIVHKP